MDQTRKARPMQIRECREADFEEIHALNSTAFGYEYELEKTKERLSLLLHRKTDKLYVACQDGHVVGYIHGCDYECTYADSLKNILALAVDERKRNLGIGRALLTAIEDWAKQCNCSGVRLVSGCERTAAHVFYRSCGYADRKLQKNFRKVFEA